MQMATQPPLIAHIVYRFDVGGLENGIVNLVNGMRQERWRHAIISLTDVSEEFARRIARADVRYVALQKKPGHLVRHDQLLRAAWGVEYRSEVQLLRTAIHGLRRKLSEALPSEEYIAAEYGLGYRLLPSPSPS